MKTRQLAGLARALRASRRSWGFGAAMLAAGATQGATVEIEVWHTLTGPNKAEFEKLAKRFNKEQSDVEVELRDFSSAQTLQKDAAEALKKKKGPNLVQLADNRSPEVVRSEEHTSELQSLMRISYAVCCLKQKNT